MMTINLNELLAAVTIADEDDIKYEITYLNYLFAVTTMDCLHDTTIGSTVNWWEELWRQMLYILVRTDKTRANEFISVILSSSLDLANELTDNEEPIQDLCYLIGTATEVEQNYTIIERMIIITAIMRFLDINLIFD